MIGEIIKAIPKKVEGGVAAKKDNESTVIIESSKRDSGHGAITHHYTLTRTQTLDFVSEDTVNNDEHANVQGTTNKKKRMRFGCCCFGKAD